MIKKFITSGLIFATLFCASVFGRDVIVSNQLSDQWLVIKQLYQMGVSTDEVTDILIEPNSKKTWVIRIPAQDDYFYGLKIFAASNPIDFNTAQLICKTSTTKSTQTWFPFDLANIDCNEDESLSDQPGYDPENEPYSVVIKPIKSH